MGSFVVDPADRDTAPIFADGAGAMILDKVTGSKKGFIGFAADNDGSQRGLLTIEHGKKMDMKGRRLALEIIRLASKLVEDVLNNSDLTAKDIDRVVSHQPNERIIDMMEARNDFRPGVIIRTIKHMGNSSSATVPITHLIASDSGEIREGDKVLYLGLAIGIGGSALIYQN